MRRADSVAQHPIRTVNSVWNTFRSQVHALRWWLLVWGVVLLGWGVGRWTYLTEFRETWVEREKAYSAGVLALSALLTATLVNLHSPARKTAGWRAWPIRPWKIALAQFAFLLLFLVLLPGLFETVLSWHPNLEGLENHSTRRWVFRFLWPLPIAMGLAACNHSLRTFLRDAIVLVALGVWILNMWQFVRWDLFTHNPYRVVVVSMQYLVPVGVGLWFVMMANRGRPRVVRSIVFLVPLVVWAAGFLTKDRLPASPMFGAAGVMGPHSSAPAPKQDRIRLTVPPDPKASIGTREYSGNQTRHCLVQAQVEGLAANEIAQAIFAGAVVSRDGAPVEVVANPAGGMTSFFHVGYFGDNDWTPWSQPRIELQGTTVWHDTLELFHVAESSWDTFPVGPVTCQGTVHLHVREWKSVLRLPLRQGAVARNETHDAQVLFVGGPKEAQARGIKPHWSDSGTVCRVVVRRFDGRDVMRSLPQARLVHMTTGTQCQSGVVETRDVGLLRGTGDTFRRTDFSRTGPGVPVDPLTHPEEFEIVFCELGPVGSVSHELVIAPLIVKP